MSVLSVLRKTFPPVQSVCRTWKLNGTTIQVRKAGGGPRKMEIMPSNFSWHQFKDYLHFYLMVGIIPLTLLVTYCNIFIGPAELREIPEGYVPKKWEYYRHCLVQKKPFHYFTFLHEIYGKFVNIIAELYIFITLVYFLLNILLKEKIGIKIEDQVKTAMKINMDSTANYWYRPPVTKYMMGVRKEFEEEEREYVMTEE
ncbi:NADH dehydrogenase [ubiquinone] 1 beta subcomplex subunit 5, mitochondrial [Armadillidium nasatum]|uniref:NADH dehydrogenase [ubiquinone] 1 beta subcomplex subunit 5, mitochondrial n=1 Tax=Armadillidium nasatum TaxID=96803 RepID=A0A5N5T7L0_9CRUS|nr:NADH dehydrogenase [ubiquinone] 1 beta subcomplex subunit 5, mitochondrial [Armadillidium nasatum]